MDDNNDTFLDSLLKKTTGSGSRQPLLPGECLRLTSFFTPLTNPSTRGKAFLCLSSICDHQRTSARRATEEDDPGTRAIIHLFKHAIDAKLSEVEERPLLEIISFTGALFAVDWRGGCAVFNLEGFQDAIMDALDLFPASSLLPSAIASVLSLALGHKSCLSNLSPRCIAWLDSTFHRTVDVQLKAAVSLSLLKLGQSSESERTAPMAEPSVRLPLAGQQDLLLRTLRDIIVSSTGNLLEVADALEGLAYFTTKPSVKEEVAKDDILLRKMVSFQSSLPKKSASLADLGGTAPFGLATVIANLSSYRPQLSEEQAQIERLRKMAQPGSTNLGNSQGRKTSGDDLNDNAYVKERGKRLMEVGAVNLLIAIARMTDSAAVRATVGKGILGLVEDKDNRGKILQAGGAKSLMSIIRTSQQPADPKSDNPLAKANMEYVDLTSIQALAKLCITASPLQVFGPDENATIEAIKPLACLLLHSTSTLLQKFESLMALTNISSTGPELASRIAETEGLLNNVEYLLLEENVLVRRAAAELICNLVSGSETAFNRFSGENHDESTSLLNQSKSRLHILIALADVDDEATRLAASGALAILTGSPTACKLILLLQLEHHRVFPILLQLISPSDEQGDQSVSPANTNPGLMHRGVVCVRNILVSTTDGDSRRSVAGEATNCKLVDALVTTIKSAGQGVPEAVLRPAAESLKWLMESDVNVLV